MAAPSKPGQSRWGYFLSSAVTGMESRLDNMLDDGSGSSDEDEWSRAPSSSNKQPKQQAQMEVPKPAEPAASSSTDSAAAKAPAKPAAPPRSSSNTRVNDRLQARLAKAMAGKSSPSHASPSGRSSFDSRDSIDRPSMDASATAANGEKKEEEEEAASSPAGGAAVAPADASEAVTQDPTDEKATADGETTTDAPNKLPDSETKNDTEAPTSEAINEPQVQIDKSAGTKAETRDISPPGITVQSSAEVAELTKTVEEMKTRQEEEIQEYVERIDSLQSKLQYLSKTAAESAKKSAASAASGSAERKLAEKDEKIALLMEEGQKLSNTEQKFRTSIKKLRQQMAENEKQAEELRKGKDKAVADAEALRNRLDGSEEKERRQEEARKATAALQKEIDTLKKERTAKDEAMRKLEQDVKTKTEKAEAAATEAHNKAIAAERQKQKELEETNAALKADKEAIADKAKMEEVEWREKLERATQRSTRMETEMKTELKNMESKMEAMRAVAEEASSGVGGDSQVKLIRQIETLQSQYATASDNWQGIEASLLAKVANLEKERDEAQRRESEMRKKARDAASRSRRLEDDLQAIQPELASTKQELESCREQLSSLRSSSKATETALEQARSDLEKQQKAAARDFQGESERRPWADDAPVPSPRIQSRPESPLLSITRTFSSDLMGFQAPGKTRRTPVGSIPDSPLDSSRRMSSQPPGRSSALSNVGSVPAPSPFSPFEPPSDPMNMASPSLAGREDLAEDKVPSSPRNVAQDMVSVSTVGAGPSVQLVERMSAAIRRLEGEKVAAKEEMTRVCSQRDEARSDMVGLMKEIETAKAAASKVEDLEKELEDINSRYQTTLELLGEKSELVEELRADVQDVKEMYRDLVQQTVK